MSSIKITKKPSKKVFANKEIENKKRVLAADEEFDDFDEFDMDDSEDADGLMDSVDDVADQVEEIQDTIEDESEDAASIEVNNNISDHYIAECEKCHGVFISAVIESEQEIDHVTGVCPLCNKESDQYLKWVIKDNK